MSGPNLVGLSRIAQTGICAGVGGEYELPPLEEREPDEPLDEREPEPDELLRDPEEPLDERELPPEEREPPKELPPPGRASHSLECAKSSDNVKAPNQNVLDIMRRSPRRPAHFDHRAAAASFPSEKHPAAELLFQRFLGLRPLQ